MATPYLGEICALCAAACWSIALVLFKRSGESVSPLSLSLFKNVVVIVPFLVTLVILGEVTVLPDGLTIGDLLILILSGIIGIAIADTILFYSLNVIGVGLVTIAECVYTPTVVLFAWMLLSEEVATQHYVGGALVLSGVFVSSTHKPPAGRTRRQLVLGLIAGAFAISLMSLGIVIAKPVIEKAPTVWAAFVRLAGGTAVLALIMALSAKRAKLFTVFMPSASWKDSIPASLLGTYLAMILWIAGFKYTHATIAAVLNQTSTIMALILASVVLKEPFTKRKCTAALLAIAGVIVVTLGSAFL